MKANFFKIIHTCNNGKNLLYVSSYHKNKQRENQQGSTEVSYLQEVGCGMALKLVTYKR